jgi:hypothetical protein
LVTGGAPVWPKPPKGRPAPAIFGAPDGHYEPTGLNRLEIIDKKNY